MELEPRTELVVEYLTRLKYEVAITQDLLGESVIELLNLRDLGRF